MSYILQSFQIGDWVSGTSFKDERFRGYIEDIQNDSGYVTIRMVETDHKQAIGKITKSHIKKLKKLKFNPFYSIGQILNLVDIALINRDEKWFMELTTELKRLQQHQQQHQIKKINSHSSHRWSK